MSRPRKVDYNEVISAWLRSGDATMIAATMKLGKSTVYKILHKHEYGLLGVDGGEPLALRDLKPAAPVAWAEQPTVMAEKMAALTGDQITDCFPRFKRDGDILTPLPSYPPDPFSKEAIDSALNAQMESLKQLGTAPAQMTGSTHLPTATKELADALHALSMNGKTAATSNKIAMDRECGCDRSVVAAVRRETVLASIALALCLAMPVALVAYMVWDWWVAR